VWADDYNLVLHLQPGSDVILEPTSVLVWSLLGGLGILAGRLRRQAAPDETNSVECRQKGDRSD